MRLTKWLTCLHAVSPGRGLISFLSLFHHFAKSSKHCLCVVLTLNVRGPSYLGLTRSISWSLMPWLLASPGHQQPWYWLWKTGNFWFDGITRHCNLYLSSGPLLLLWFNSNPSMDKWLSNHYKVWDEITNPFPNFNRVTIEVWEWISNSIPHIIGHKIAYPCWD